MAVVAGGGGGGGNGWSGVTPRPDRLPAGDAGAEIGAWFAANLGLVMAIGATIVVLALVLLALSFIAQGGLTHAVTEIARGHTVTARDAWGVGWRLASRYLGLWLLLVVAIGLVAAFIAAIVAAGVGLGAASSVGGPIWILLALAIIAALPLIVAGLIVAIGLAIVVTYAQRAIAIRDHGPVEALRDGWRLLRAEPGKSLLVWLLSVGLAIGVGIGVGIAMAIGFGIFGGAAALLWFTSGLSPTTIATAIVGGLALLAVGVVLSAVANTFFWSYWTLAYLRLTEGDQPLPATIPTGPVAPPISSGPVPA